MTTQELSTFLIGDTEKSINSNSLTVITGYGGAITFLKSINEVRVSKGLPEITEEEFFSNFSNKEHPLI